MLFLIDYENVGNAGMHGCGFLHAGDWVIVFYSKDSPNMEARFLEMIRDSGCRFEVCKLAQKRKNALDFYIASRLGEIFGAGYDGVVAIVTGDAGLTSIRDYWTLHAKPARRVYISSSLERAIISAGGKKSRVKTINRMLSGMSIDSFYAAYEAEEKHRAQLKEAFAGTEYASRIREIEAITRKNESSRLIYLEALKTFGRKDGLEIYRKLKGCILQPLLNKKEEKSKNE